VGCLNVPVPVLPVLPTGFSLSPPALPALPLPVTLCCKITLIPTIPFPVTLPSVTVSSAFLIGVNAAMAVAQAYMDALTIPCPRDG
jgi:hypothetical protein